MTHVFVSKIEIERILMRKLYSKLPTTELMLFISLCLIFAHFVGTTIKTNIKCNRRRATSNLTKIKSTPGDKNHRLISFSRKSTFFFLALLTIIIALYSHEKNKSHPSSLIKVWWCESWTHVFFIPSSSWHDSWQTRAQGCVKGNKKKLPPIKTCSLEINGISATNRSLGKEWRGSRLSCWFLSEIGNH